MTDTHDTHGLTEGMRVIEQNGDGHVEGTIQHIDADAGTATVRWDNAHTGEANIDELVPVEGW